MSPTVQHLIPKLRFSEFSGNWQKMKLWDIASFEQWIQVDIEEQCNEPKEGYTKFLRIENYTQNSQDFRYIPNKNLRDKQLVEDEVVAVRYWATAWFIWKWFSWVLANNLFKINAEPYISNIFLYIQLKKEETFAWMQAQMAWGAMPALNFWIMKVLPISFPSLLEQIKIASFLSAIDEKIQQITDLKSAIEKSITYGWCNRSLVNRYVFVMRTVLTFQSGRRKDWGRLLSFFLDELHWPQKQSIIMEIFLLLNLEK